MKKIEPTKNTELLKSFMVKKTDVGLSVFVNKNYYNSDKIMDFKGNIITGEELPNPFTEKDDHCVQIGNNLYMGPSGDVDDFVNHSCDPNSGLIITEKKVTLIAIKEINKGDELKWDYSTTMDEDNWEMKCMCGSSKCRKIVRDFKYLPIEIQRKYINLGIVPEYITKKLL